jgi:hypothetical protein
MNDNTIKSISVAVGIFLLSITLLIMSADLINIDTTIFISLISTIIGIEIKNSYEIGYLKAKVLDLRDMVYNIISKKDKD